MSQRTSHYICGDMNVISLVRCIHSFEKVGKVTIQHNVILHQQVVVVFTVLGQFHQGH